MPVAATRLADVLARHPHPAVAVRVQEHLLDQAAAPILGNGALGERRAAARDPLHHVVAQLLQLAQAQEPGARART